MTNYEAGEAAGLEKGVAACLVLLEKLGAAKNDAAEWKVQHENLLAMFRAAEQRAIKAEALQSQAAPTGWQPIDTAPKDGTVILLRKHEDSLCGYASKFRPLKRHAVGFFDQWWVIGVPGGHSTGGDDKQFTHWMPLPAAPLPQRDAE